VQARFVGLSFALTSGPAWFNFDIPGLTGDLARGNVVALDLGLMLNLLTFGFPHGVAVFFSAGIGYNAVLLYGVWGETFTGRERHLDANTLSGRGGVGFDINISEGMFLRSNFLFGLNILPSRDTREFLREMEELGATTRGVVGMTAIFNFGVGFRL